MRYILFIVVFGLALQGVGQTGAAITTIDGNTKRIIVGVQLEYYNSDSLVKTSISGTNALGAATADTLAKGIYKVVAKMNGYDETIREDIPVVSDMITYTKMVLLRPGASDAKRKRASMYPDKFLKN